MKSPLILLSTLAALSSCTWVNENQAAKEVFAVLSSQTNNCQKVGSIQAEVKHQIGFIKRREHQVNKELQILAKNEAVNLGANTIVASHKKPIEGKQDYDAFICPR